MDAIEFLKTCRRICKAYRNSENTCENCEIQVLCNEVFEEMIEEMSNESIQHVAAVAEQWAKDHPQKTYLQDFFEKFPNADKREQNGLPYACKSAMYGTVFCRGVYTANTDCVKCWNQPMEE